MNHDPHEPRWRRYLRFHRADHRADLDDELRDHLQSTVDALMARGLSADEARAEAHRRFGDVNAVRSTVARIDATTAGTRARAAWFTNLRQDITYALRQLRRAPLFTAVATLSIALGVGLNITIFSVANAILFRAPPGVRVEGLQRVYVNHHGAFQWQELEWFRERATL